MVYRSIPDSKNEPPVIKAPGALLIKLAAISVIIAVLTTSCAGLIPETVPTPLPAEYMPTAIALTLEAGGVEVVLTSTATATTAATNAPPSATWTLTQEAAPSASSTSQTAPSETSYPAQTEEPSAPTSPPSTAPTDIPFTIAAPVQINPPALAVPESSIQIYQLGELSMVISPILVTTRLTSGNGKVVRIDLYGEDGRLLARHVRVFDRLPWSVAKVGVDLEFEISAAAEIGRLVVSVEDPYGRIIDVNSVNLVLLSMGINELNAASTLWQAIVIQEPQPNAFIQGGTVYVSGLARPYKDQPLKVALIAEDGRILGQRLAGLTIPSPGEYGTFFAEVPYYVTEFTPVLLVVYEDGGFVSEFTHLTSIDIILTP